MPKKSLLALGLIGSLVVGAIAFVKQPVVGVARTGPVVTAEAAALEANVRALAKPRPMGDVEALEAAATTIRSQLQQIGFTPEDQPYDVAGKTYRNVRLVIGEKDQPRLVLGAHYDSYREFPAADDNASGCALLLELARLFKSTPPPGAVELVWWTLEEPPAFRREHMGSAVHAKRWAEEKTVVTGVLSIETVGFFSDAEHSQHFPFAVMGALYPSRGDFVGLVSNTANTAFVRKVKAAMRSVGSLPIESINAPEAIPGIDWSDHRSAWPYGVPSLMVTDTAPNRNPNYHQATDTPDTLNYVKLARLTEAVFEAAWALTSAGQATPNMPGHAP